MYRNPVRGDGGEVPPSVLESRTVEIVEYLADGRADELPYFDEGAGGPDIEEIKTVWDRLLVAFGEFGGIDGTTVDEDENVVTVDITAGDESLVCRAVYDDFGEISGFWIRLADADGPTDEFRRSMPSSENVKDQVSSYVSRMKDRIKGEGTLPESTVRSTAREVVDSLAAGDVEAVREMMNPHLRRQVPPSKLRDEWTSLGGSFEGIETVEVFPDLNTAEVIFETEGGRFRARVTVDVEERVAGLFFREDDAV